MTTNTRLSFVVAALLVLFIFIAAISLTMVYQPEIAFTLFEKLNLATASGPFWNEVQTIAGECNTANGGNCGY
jgi:hypothetical protein